MQQAIFNPAMDTITAFPSFSHNASVQTLSQPVVYTRPAGPEDMHKAVIHSYNNWEFFMNELEYE
ncbi:hypothetical protein EXU57_01385 [Segetibacter sp. 3557_3]|uniref:hypothetical protein n=1 Tax=Segetibacter sp. 3557_3 TaxID=2547429 RepID=UPI0010584CB1|nr:hypothetical protein [Segetibacter sp. 3557_3]TDH28752.1 hypothetical protein EXU57_01385 [Segetibacter sp. 3557_3]